ncbi:MAG: Hpt domain-containing protein, partial [Desulfobulbaceae bacterium]|nr:Hpt domain-containing protein [Desulfobulbaceae bacterium]
MSHDNGIDYSNMSMMEMFQEETRRLSADMSTDLLALEQDPENADLLESLMRESHTVKGAARMAGLESIVLLSHTIENIFVAAQEKKLTLDKESIDTLLKGIDIVSALAEMQCDDIESWIADHPDDIQESVNDCASLNDRAPLNSREDLPSTDDATD